MTTCYQYLAENITCNSLEHLQLSHLPSGNCTSENYSTVFWYGIGFVIVHALLWGVFLLSFCFNAYWGKSTGSKNKLFYWGSFVLWMIVSLLFIAEHVLIAQFNMYAISTRLVEYATFLFIVGARFYTNVIYFPNTAQSWILHWSNAIMVSTIVFTGITVFVYACTENTILYAYFLWIGITQLIDVLRICVLNINTTRNTYAYTLRGIFGIFSVIFIIVGLVLTSVQNYIAALVLLGLNKTLLVLIGYLFVLFPPISDPEINSNTSEAITNSKKRFSKMGH